MVAGTTLGAQPSRVVVEVKGLACPFCAYGLEKQFKEVSGVTEIRIDVEQGLLSFTWTAQDPVDKKEIKRLVKKAGFTAGMVTVREADGGMRQGQSIKEKDD